MRDIAIDLLQFFPERLLNKKLLFDAVFGSRDETKIGIRNSPRSRFYRLSIPAHHSVPINWTIGDGGFAFCESADSCAGARPLNSMSAIAQLTVCLAVDM